MKTILVTGGAGFIGANFIEFILEEHGDYQVINVDKLTYAGDLIHLKKVQDHVNYTFVQGDICDRALIEMLFTSYDITGVFHLAAESHVDNSISGPEVFIDTNIKGTFNVLDVAYKYWMESPGTYKKGYENCRFLQVSTDEVYGSLGEKGLFTEETAYAPNSPYSASKASADMLVRSYHHTYGMNTVITNCSNNYGPKQHAEKLIPTIIRKIQENQQIPVYGDGKNVRDWLYVKDHCVGLLLAFEKGRAGEVYNIGGKNEMTNLQIVRLICASMDILLSKDSGTCAKLITFVQDRAGHDYRYAIDASKIEDSLGWKASENFKTGIQKTIAWYLNK
ncbi:MAG: dTDP-glucose 4,6-dehydratase [Flavobacteriaceae bacterium]|nr:MAG: dTDP-glucose 4,6-dehydratase [Flavobacteriaceae bacterium]